MTRTLLDTDIYSEVIRGKNAEVQARARDYVAEHGKLLISTVTIVEVVKGLHKARRHEALERFIHSLGSTEVLALGSAEAVVAGRIYGDLERTGQPIGRIDPLIAGIAMCYGLVLATGNVEHYQRIQALGYDFEIDNWRNKAP